MMCCGLDVGLLYRILVDGSLMLRVCSGWWLSRFWWLCVLWMW